MAAVVFEGDGRGRAETGRVVIDLALLGPREADARWRPDALLSFIPGTQAEAPVSIGAGRRAAAAVPMLIGAGSGAAAAAEMPTRAETDSNDSSSAQELAPR